jgi:DNA-directed RNA polymerases I and III subunit RPAC1
MNVTVVKQYKNYLEFDLVGCDTSLANALRRIVISEVSTMAIETVFVMNNTSVIQDEVLSHRLGLVPIHADPRKFDYLPTGGEPTDVNTIVFELHARCSVNPEASNSPAETDPKKKFINSSVYSDQFKWIPQGSQEEIFAQDPIRPSHSDILLAKMRPGQEIDLEVHCIKGIGREHAKWSPVCKTLNFSCSIYLFVYFIFFIACASYRLMPQIEILSPITGGDAEKFASCFAPGVIALKKSKSQEISAVVENARYDTVSRECLRHPEFKDKVALKRVADHFIFQIESVGFYAPDQIVIEAIKILAEKCVRLRDSLENF